MTKIGNTLFVLLSLVIDVAVSTILFVHGTKWNIFLSSIVNYSFSESFIDIWLWTIARACIIIGCLLGTLRNPEDGPNRLKQQSWIATTVGCLNAYYTCIKLLSFSEQPGFTIGSTMKWFWALFSWNLFGIGIFIYQWNCVSKAFNLEKKRTGNSEKDEETQSLLGNGVSSNKGYSSINSTEPDGSFVQYSDGKSNAKSKSTPSKSKGKKASGKKEDEKEEKTFSELVNKATLGKMFSFVVPDWPLILTGLIFLVGASVAEVFLPLFTGKVVTGIVVSGDRSIFAKNLVEMAAISMVASICAGLRGGCFMVTIQRLNIRVRNALFSSILSQEIGFFDEVRTGEITSRLTSDTTTMSDTVGLNCNIFLRSLIKGFGVCVFMFALSWRLSVVTFMGLPLVFAVSKVYGKYYKKLQEQVQDRFAYANEVAEEVCSSMQTVRSFANENGEKKRYDDRLKDVYQIQLKQSISYSGYLWSTEITGLLLVVGVLWYGGHLVLSNLMGSDSIVSFVLYQFTMADCLNSVGSVYTGLMQALGAAEKVFGLIDRTPKISTEEGKLEPPNLEGHIKFENVTFTYPTRPEQPVLQDVSFEVRPGEVVALVGPSGGGKSSCVKLIQRFYDCTSGSVLVDGRPVNCYKHDYLHEKIALVGQEPVLYARSISENIAYGLEGQKYSEESIQQAAKTANAHTFISELKDGYKTETGEKGTQLSGGQKQRVAIARALVRNPRILLLDEATSALDAESEFLVQEALERSKADRTVLLIAHRLSTVERADRIVVIVKGKVVEQGSHLELMAKEGLYFKLVHRQLHTSTGDDEKAIDQLPNDDDVATTSHTSSSPVISLRRRRGVSESSSMASSFGSSLGTSLPRM